MSRFVRLAGLGGRVAASGLGAAALALSLDWLLAVLTEGYRVPLPLRLALWYPLCGMVAALLLGALDPGAKRGRCWLFAATLAALYAPPIVERLSVALRSHLPRPPAALVALFALTAYGLLLSALGRTAGRSRGTTALVLGALVVAVGLALNRSLVRLPAEPAALALDAAVLSCGFFAAWASRRLEEHRRAWQLAGGALALLLVAAVAWRLAPPAAAQPAPQPVARAPVLLLTIVDTLRYDVFDDVVHSTAEGRRFQALLGDATWFTQTTAVAPWTAPSVASIMTGLYPAEHRFGIERSGDPNRPLRALAPAATTLAELLSEHGFATTAVTTNPFLQAESGIAQGFDSFEMLQDPTAKLPLLTALRWSGFFESDLYQPAAWACQRFERQLRPLLDSGRPVFAWLHLMDPHSPLRQHPQLAPDPGGAGLSELERSYRDEVRYAVLELARLLERLARHPRWSETSLVLLSDHGEMLPSDQRFAEVENPPREERRYGHGHALYDELIKVPLVIRPAGGSEHPRRLATMLSHVDLLPTLLDLAGVSPPPLPDGRLSAMALLDPAARRRAHRVATLSGATSEGPTQHAWRSRRFKLIHYPGGERLDELFDLAGDPRERHDLAPQQPARVRRLARRLQASWDELQPQLEHGAAVTLDEETRKQLEALGYR